MKSFRMSCIFGLVAVSLTQAGTAPAALHTRKTIIDVCPSPECACRAVFQAELIRSTGLRQLEMGRSNEFNLTSALDAESGKQRNPGSFQILIRAPQDFAIASAPNWKVSRLFLTGAFFVMAGLGLFAWAFQAQLSQSGATAPEINSPALVYGFGRAAKIVAAIAGAIAVLNLIGWLFGIEELKRVAAGYIPMMPNTAVAFIAAAVYFSFAHDSDKWRFAVQSICASAVIAIGMLTSLEYIAGLDLNIDQLLFARNSDLSIVNGSPRMAFISAVAFVLLGLALLLNRKRFVLVSQWLAIGSGVISILNLVGYLYGLQEIEVSAYKFMAVHTALCFLLLSLALLFRTADSGVMTVLSSSALGGVMGRRLIPAALLLPAMIGWIRWQGELKGLYGTVFGLSLFSSAVMAAFAFLIWTSAILLNRLDVSRSQTERELRLLIDGTKDYAIFMLDRDGKIASWNGGAERIKGYSAQEAIGQHLSFLYENDFSENEDTSPDHSQKQAADVLRIATAEGRYEEEAWHVRRDGARFWAHVVITALKDKRGQLRGFSNVTRDATELKKATGELVAACQRAEEANRAKSDFLATMSHEIRTPMNSILGMTDLVMETGLNPIQREYVDRCRRAGANLLNLINDILDLSKIESSRFELEQIPFNLADLVGRTADLIAPKAQLKDLVVTTHLTPGTPLVLIGDPYRLQQLLINLLGNSVKFTQHGQISLNISPHADSESGHLVFEVSDTGIGIPEDKLGSIFDDFIQAESSTTRRFGGSGLGLGIARRLANRMGGELTAASLLGQGSTFRFDARFVVSEELLPTELPIPAHELVGRRVLVIDSNDTNRMIASKMCFSWGMIPVESASVSEAHAMLRDDVFQRPFSLAIIDVVMLEGDGLADFSKVHALLPEVPIIMTSSDNKPGEATRAKALGAAAYAVNPVSSADLFRLVAAAVRPAGESESVKSAARSSVGGSRILIAEDSEDNRFLLEAYLMDQPFEVTYVEDGEQAISAFQKESFGLVLMDVQMPVMDGLKATELIREFEHKHDRSRTPILALTANAFLSDRELSQAAGCDGHLSKPISKETLVAAVKSSILSHAPAAH